MVILSSPFLNVQNHSSLTRLANLARYNSIIIKNPAGAGLNLWGPWSDGKRTISPDSGPVSPQKTDFCLIDDSEFGMVLGPNGQKRILFPDEAQISRENLRRAPHPPRIQRDLLEARQLKERLDNSPGLSKTALAKELGITRFELIRRLNLLRLAPEIQNHILAMPPALTVRGPISKRSLRNIAVISDVARQRAAFNRLLGSEGARAG